MNQLYYSELQSICLASGFVKRGKAYFRIVGDGVLQVIKSEYERVFRSEIINIGLFSMYADLWPQWFTASGCIPRYSIVNCFNQNNKSLVSAPSESIQIDMLRNGVMPWLDSIDTQKRLIMAITKLDRRWNDGLKIRPYLACGEINHAKKVVREIIGQHNFARVSKMETQDWSTNQSLAQCGQDDRNLYRLLEMLDRGDATEVDNYLRNNFDQNMIHAKFCVKGIRSKQKTSE